MPSNLVADIEMNGFGTSPAPPSTTVETKESSSVINALASNEYLEDQDIQLLSTNSTRGDAVDMQRMGKEQELVRRFRLLSMASFVGLTTVSWEYGVFTLGPGLLNGGRAGLIYSTAWSFIGFGPVYLSMAEMASIAPIAGAQYHWVSEFAPESCQRILSYLVGYVLLV